MSKIRLGFISNSSSSSFVLNKLHLSDDQIKMIKDYKYYAPKVNDLLNSSDIAKVVCGEPCLEKWSLVPEGWSVEETEDFIFLETFLDNFDFEAYLKIIRADDSEIEFGELPDNYFDKNELKQLNSKGFFKRGKS